MFYLIRETLCSVPMEEIRQGQYVATVTSAQWVQLRDYFDMGIDLEPDTTEIFTTQAEVNVDSLTGTFLIPDRADLSAERGFAFALDEKGIVFIDDTGTAERYIHTIRNTRKWRLPSLERFLYDFLDLIVREDLRILEKFERELDDMELTINADEELPTERVHEIRSNLRDLLIHYEQLADLGQELEENENNFFQEENLRYFRLFLNRVAMLRDRAASLRDHTMQIQDLYTAHLDIKQNRIMTVLTVVTTIFMPLTLIVGWYGMNFRYMPELNYRWSYPAVAILSLAIVLWSLWYFKRKKWL